MEFKENVTELKKLISDLNNTGNIDDVSKKIAQLVASFAALNEVSKNASSADMGKLSKQYKQLADSVKTVEKSKNKQKKDTEKLTKIERQNLQVKQRIDMLEEKMKSHQHGKIKAVKKEIANARELQKQLHNINLTEKQRLDIVGKIGIVSQRARTAAGKGTLTSEFISNFSPNRIASRASFVTTARIAYSAMDSINTVIRDAISLNVKLQDELSKTFGIAVNGSKEFRDSIKTGVLEVMREFNQTIEESTEAIYNIISAQIEEDKALNVLKVSAASAKANFSDFGDTAKLVSGILNAYNMDANNAARVSDVLSESIRLGVVTMKDYEQSLGKLMPSASSVGFSLEEVSSVIATLTSNGMRADMAMTSLRQAFQMITSPTKKQQKLLKEYNIQLDARVAKEKGLIGTLEMLGGLMLEDEFALATSRRGREAYLGVINNLSEAHANYNKIMEADGATAKILAERTSTLSSSLDTLYKTLTQLIAVNSLNDGFFGWINKKIIALNDAFDLMLIPTIEEFNKTVSSNMATSSTILSLKRMGDEMKELEYNSEDFNSKLETVNNTLSGYGLAVDANTLSQKEFNNQLSESIRLYSLVERKKMYEGKKIDVEFDIERLEAERKLESGDISAWQQKRESAKRGAKSIGIKGDDFSRISSMVSGFKGIPFGEQLGRQITDPENPAQKAKYIADKYFQKYQSSKYEADLVTDKEIDLLSKYISMTFFGEEKPSKSGKLIDIENQLNANATLLNNVNKELDLVNNELEEYTNKIEEQKKKEKKLKDIEEKYSEKYFKFKEGVFETSEIDTDKQKRSGLQQKKTQLSQFIGNIPKTGSFAMKTLMDNMKVLEKAIEEEIQKLDLKILKKSESLKAKYYNAVKFQDEGYYKWKMKQIDKEIALMEFQDDEEEKLYRKKLERRLKVDRAAYQESITPKTFGQSFLESIGVNAKNLFKNKSKIKPKTEGKSSEASETSDAEKEVDTLTPQQKAQQESESIDFATQSAVSSVQQLTSNLLSIWQQYYQNRLQARLNSLEEERLAEVETVNTAVMSAEHRQNEINVINNKYVKKKEKEEARLAKEQAKMNKKIAIAQATMSFATGSMNIWTMKPFNPIMVGVLQALLTGAYGTNLALINKQKFEDGGITQGAPHAQGGIQLFGKDGTHYGEAEGGEMIHSKRATRGNEAYLQAQNKYLSKGGTPEGFMQEWSQGKIQRATYVPKAKFRDGGITGNGTNINNVLDKLDGMSIIDARGVDGREIYQLSRMNNRGEI